jgi:hypothetical protein
MSQFKTDRRHDLITAITSCGHSIDHDEVTLRFDPKQEGHNAFNQLNNRVTEWAEQREAALRSVNLALAEALVAAVDVMKTSRAPFTAGTGAFEHWHLVRQSVISASAAALSLSQAKSGDKT